MPKTDDSGQAGAARLSNPKPEPDSHRIARLERELTELRQQNTAAQAERDVLSRALESLSDGLALFDADDRLVLCNSRFKELNPELASRITTGMTFEDMVRDNIAHGRILDAVGREEDYLRERMERHRNPGPPILTARKDGVWLLLREERTPNGETFLVNTDVTELKQREEDFRQNEALFRAVVDNAPTKIHIKDTEGRYLLINPLAERLFGVSDEEGRGKSSYELFSREVADLFMAHDREVASSGKTTEREETFLLEDGEHTFLTVKFPIFSEGKVTAVGAIGTDITARKRAELAVQESEIRFKSIVDSSAAAITVKDRTGNFTMVNQTFADWTGKEPEELVGRDIYAVLTTDQADQVAASDQQVLQTGEKLSGERTRTFENGETRNIITHKAPIFSADGEIVAVSSIDLDVTDSKRVEASHERLIAAVEEMAEMLAIYDPQDRLIVSNRVDRESIKPANADSYLGWTFEEMIRDIVRRGKIASARGHEEEWIQERLARHRNPRGSFEIQHGEGIWFELMEQKLPDGGTLVLGTNITERKKVEEQLLRAQRMEAVGQLTGGVAHDFNNLLAIMIGNAEIIEDHVRDNETAARSVASIISAIDRGAALTNRLLAFSRRQTLSPVSADIGALIDSLEDLLKRTLGETIDLRVDAMPGLWPAILDPHQFENALINLAINARDAMPEGGSLVLETANVTLDDAYVTQHEEVSPGNYVMVAVSDTGTGIAAEDTERVFEPFFTTKDVGKGSGLGLSMVYGFVKQSGGHVTIYSEPGLGTTVKLYLPQSREAAIGESDSARAPVPAAGSESILVVEDDENVREISAQVLRGRGYTVVEAEHGAEAIAHLQGDTPFDLLFTDVVLPGGMNGIQIADAAKNLHPDIKVLYTTGYAENAVLHHGTLEPGASLINKPFRGAALLETVRTILDGGDV